MRPDMIRRILKIAWMLVVTALASPIGAALGLFLGMMYGGNYATSFEFAGNRGYEAAGLLGALIGAVALPIVVVTSWIRITKKVRPA